MIKNPDIERKVVEFRHKLEDKENRKFTDLIVVAGRFISGGIGRSKVATDLTVLFQKKLNLTNHQAAQVEKSIGLWLNDGGMIAIQNRVFAPIKSITDQSKATRRLVAHTYMIALIAGGMTPLDAQIKMDRFIDASRMKNKRSKKP